MEEVPGKRAARLAHQHRRVPLEGHRGGAPPRSVAGWSEPAGARERALEPGAAVQGIPWIALGGGGRSGGARTLPHTTASAASDLRVRVISGPPPWPGCGRPPVSLRPPTARNVPPGPFTTPSASGPLDSPPSVGNVGWRRPALSRRDWSSSTPPSRGADGDAGALSLGDYAVSVFLFIDAVSCKPVRDGRRCSARRRGEDLRRQGCRPPGLPQRDTLTVPLAASSRFSMISGHRGRAVHGELYAACYRRRRAPSENCSPVATSWRKRSAADTRWVMTHGQMHARNIVWTDDDQLLFVDWDRARGLIENANSGKWAKRP